MDNALTTKNKWEQVWADVKLPSVAKPGPDVQNLLGSLVSTMGECSLLEVGCAPGGWMAYFNRQFGYSVSGLEYAEAAAEITKKNMELLGINAKVIVEDFFDFDGSGTRFDIVFSHGFIEHFRDPFPVVERICGLARRYVVTIVPNLFGVNGFISRTIRPEVYAEHSPIDLPILARVHEKCGIKTLFCDYIGGVRFIMPAAHTRFFNRHKGFARAVNMPVRGFNLVSGKALGCLGWTPRTRLLSDSLLYVGVRK